MHRRTFPILTPAIAVGMSGCSLLGDRIMGTWELTDWEYDGYDGSDFDDVLVIDVTMDFDHKTKVSVEGELNVSIEAEVYSYNYYDYSYGYYGIEPFDTETRTLEFQTPVEAVNEGSKEYEIEVEGWKRIEDTDWECDLDNDELLCDGDEGLEMVFKRI